MLRKPKFIAGLVVTTVAFSVASVAFATWASNGSGSGKASSLSSQDSAITAAVFGADLYPGAVKSVTVAISNPNPYPVMVTSISPGSSAVLASPDCAVGSVTSDAVGPNSSGITRDDAASVVIPATGSGKYRLTTRMVVNPDEGCKSREFTLSLTATLQSAAHVS